MTDSNFQSFVPAVRNVEDIKNKVGEILSNQENVVRKTTPMESEFWTVENKKDFTLELRNVDRLYYHEDIIHNYRRYFENSYHKIRMVGRVQYKNKFIYFELFEISISLESYLYVSTSQYKYIYFSEDPFIFMDVIRYNRDDEFYANMVKSLSLDGIVPKLSYMCQQKLYKFIDHVEMPLFVKRRLNIDRNINEEAINDYCDFRTNIFQRVTNVFLYGVSER